MNSEIEVLQYLAMHGIGQVEELESETDTDNLEATLEALQEDDLIEEDGFWYLNPSGETRLDELCRERFSDDQIENIEEIFDKFEVLDEQFKTLSEQWQSVEPGSQAASDIVGELAELHINLTNLFSKLEPDTYSVYSQYLNRLENALNEIRAGDTSYFTGTGVESYHNIWFELHDDLLRTLGRERDE